MKRQAATEALGLMNGQPAAVIDLFLRWPLDLRLGVMSWLAGKIGWRLGRHLDPDYRGVAGAIQLTASPTIGYWG
jgi:type IV secretory pathway TrbD component